MVFNRCINKVLCSAILLVGVSVTLYADDNAKDRTAIEVATQTMLEWTESYSACDMDRFAATEHPKMSGYLDFTKKVFQRTPESSAKTLSTRKEFCAKGGTRSLSTELIHAEFVGDTLVVTTKLNMSDALVDGRSRSLDMILTAVMLKVEGVWLSRYEHLQLDNEVPPQ